MEIPPGCASKYRVLRELGSGGFGIVLLARHIESDEPAALKLIHPHLVDDPVAAGRFKLEAQLTSLLRHRNVVRVLEYDLEPGQPWIAYEYLPGRALRDAMAPGGMPWRQALAIAVQVAAGLDAAHQVGVLHRDVKPANVVEAEGGTWKLADFGMARVEGAGALTASGFVVGTPGYLAPETLDGVKASQASDVYALGVMLFELLTGDLPFGRAGVLELLERARAGVRPRLASLKRELPPALDAVFDQVLAPQPMDRTPGAGCFAAQLKAILDARWASAARSVEPGVGTVKLADARIAPRSRPDETGSATPLTGRALRAKHGLAALLRKPAKRRTAPMPIAARVAREREDRPVESVEVAPTRWSRLATAACVITGVLMGLGLAEHVLKSLRPASAAVVALASSGLPHAARVGERLGDRLGRLMARAGDRATLPQLLADSYGAGFDASAGGERAERLAHQDEADREELAAIAADADASPNTADAAVVSALAHLTRFAAGCRVRYLRHFTGGVRHTTSGTLLDLPELMAKMDRPAAVGDPSGELAVATGKLVHAARLLARESSVAPGTLAQLNLALSEAIDWHRAMTWAPEVARRLGRVHAGVAEGFKALTGPSAEPVREGLAPALRPARAPVTFQE